MRMMLIAAMLAAATPAFAADPAGPARGAIDAFAAAFAKGDLATAKATHTANPVIIDEPPPYMWSGRDAFDTWLADLGKDSKAAGRTQEKLTIGNTLRAETSGSAAYVITTATYSFTQNGKAMAEPGRMTFVLQKQAAGWKIASWTWAGPRGRPAATTKPPTTP
ncbi:nuclear transport factor 2 family protein [Sandarakinorhabdus rubra]|uniref:nuclear transport factor 2 family protein n=1 Tax=Sandarakinorhabdus rubra TaxID=2672568 RepID=UPI0013D8E7FF|nr:nuclear transport factor 2 family protein [Sandarakinorhabdus rubra]